MQLTRLIYASSHDGTSVETLDQILQTSRANNVRDGITGALLTSEKNFLQLLEGDRSAVAQCILRIVQDDRHYGIQLISSGDAEHRLFMEWNMHSIEVRRVKQEILSRYTIGGNFEPFRMSQFAIEDLCRVLSANDWDAYAA